MVVGAVAPRSSHAASAGETDARRSHWLALGSLLGALAASSCCVLPLALFSLGLGGAWVGSLAQLSAWQPLFAACTIALLSAGWYFALRRPRRACNEHCPPRGASRGVIAVLAIATVVLGVALAFPWIAPLILE